MDVKLAERLAHAFQSVLRKPDGTCCQAADFHDADAKSSSIDGTSACYIVCGNAPLLIGWTRQCDGRLAAENRIDDFHGVAGRIDVGIGGLQMIVDDDMASWAALESCLLGQRCVRLDSCGDDGHVR